MRVKNIEGRRLGDNSKLAYIEFSGNEIEKYETAVQKERVLLFSKSIDWKRWNAWS